MPTPARAASPTRDPAHGGLWRKGGRALARTVRVVLIGAAALWALYLVVLNVALATPLFGKLANRDPDTLQIRYERAWSILPGRVHAKGLSIRSADSKIQFLLTLDQVTFDTSLPLLVKKRFVVTKARGSGVTFRGRTRVPSPRATPEYLDRLPPVEGLGLMPLATQKPPGEDVWDDEKWKLVTVHLEDTVAEDVREVWIDDVVVRGTNRVAGSFYLKPVRTIRIGPVEVGLEHASVGLEGKTIAEELHGRANVRIDAWDPRQKGNPDIGHHSRIEVDLDRGAVDTASIPHAEGRLAGKVDVGRLRARLDEGRVDGELTAATGALEVRSGELAGAFAATVEGRVADVHPFEDDDAPPGDAAVDVRVDGARVRRAGELLGRVARVTAHGSSDAFRVREPLEGLRFDVDLDGGRVNGVGAWSALLPAGLTMAPREGVAIVDASASGSAEHGVVKGKAKIVARGVGVARDETRVDADVTAFADGAFDVRGRRVDGRTDVVVADVDARIGTGGIRVKRVDATAVAHRLSLASPSLDALDLHVVTTGAEMPDARTLNLLLGKGSGLSVDRGRATASVGVRLQATPDGPKAEGTARVAVQGGLVHLRGLKLLGDFDLDAQLRGVDAREHTLVFDGSRASLRNVRIDGGGADARPFTAEVVTPRGRLRPAVPLAMEATMVVRASDAGPVLDAVAPDLPGIVVSAIAGSALEARGDVAVAKDGIRIDDLHAKAGQVKVRGSYATRGEKARGAMVVQLGAFSAGVALGENGGVRILDLHPWFEDQQRATKELGPQEPVESSAAAKAKR